MQLVRRLLVEAFDPGDLLLIHNGELLDRVETLRRQQLAHHLVEIERLDEQLGAL